MANPYTIFICSLMGSRLIYKLIQAAPTKEDAQHAQTTQHLLVLASHSIVRLDILLDALMYQLLVNVEIHDRYIQDDAGTCAQLTLLHFCILAGTWMSSIND